MENIVNGVSQLALSLSLLINSLLGHTLTTTNATVNTQPTVAVAQTENGPTYNISKSLSYQGYSVNMSAAIPENGGDITGNISGSCTGTITGHYEGTDNGTINGQSNVNCKVSFIQVPGTVTFSGTVNKTTKSAQLLLVFHVGAISKSQNIVVNFN